MEKSNTVRKVTVWALLFLPLVAVGIALAFMLSMGNQGVQQADASDAAFPEFEMEIKAVAGCTTVANTPVSKGDVVCLVPNGDSFVLSAFWTDIGTTLTAGGGVNAAQVVVEWGSGISGPDKANSKAVSWTGTPLNGCQLLGGSATLIVAPNFLTLANTAVAGCQQTSVLFDNAQVTGLRAEFELNCVEEGQFLIRNITGADAFNADDNNGTHLTDSSNSPVTDKDGTEVLTVICTPPNRTININVNDAADNSKKLGGTCWNVFVNLELDPLSFPNVLTAFLVDIIGDDAKDCGGSGQLGVGDLNPTTGNVTVLVAGIARLTAGTDAWSVQNSQEPVKYAENTAVFDCDLTDENCNVKASFDRVDGNMKVNVAIVGTLQDFEGADILVFDDPATNVSQVDSCTTDVNGSCSLTLAVGVYSVEIDESTLVSPFEAADPVKGDCDLTGLNQTCKVDLLVVGDILNLKTPSIANLFLTAQSAKLDPETCGDGTDVATFSHAIGSAPTSPDPKDSSETQEVGAFSLSVQYDPTRVCVSISPGAYVTNNPNMGCFPVSGEEGHLNFGCFTDTKPAEAMDASDLELAIIEVRPQPGLYSIINADQDNGVVVQIRNEECNLSDLQGHPIVKTLGTPTCPDSELTIRWLEGDVNGDCTVDGADAQILSFRWGIDDGSLLYSDRFNLVGKLRAIDIKDVQFVFGRQNSACSPESAQHPPQPPVNSKLTNPDG